MLDTNSHSGPSTPPAETYLNSLGPGSRRTIEQSLATLAGLAAGKSEPSNPRAYPWQKIDADAAVKIRRALAARYAPATANKMLAALRGVMRACRDRGLIDEPRYQAVAGLKQLKGAGRRPSRTLKDKDVAALIKACAEDGTAAGLRNAALLAVVLSTGVRREEGTELNADDYDAAKGRLHVRSPIAERDRWVELTPGPRAALDRWLAARGRARGPLLMPVDKSGAIRQRRLTDQAVYGILRSLGESAGVGPVTTRDLRCTLIVRLIATGHDYETISRRVGYLSWLSPSAYEELAKEAKRAGVVSAKRPPWPEERR